MTSCVTVMVKGDRFQAARAAADRGIPFTFDRETGCGETLGKTQGWFLRDVIEWFAEDHTSEPPYDAGSCLWYADHR